MTRVRLLFFISTIIFVVVAGFLATLLARGYRFDNKSFRLRPTGLLVVTSVPDGAQILINGELESATNATISLPPATYDVSVKKNGFLPWQKRLTIKKEEVTKADVLLFPAAPSLSALTFTGAGKPVLSPDGTKIAYSIPKQGLWMMELGDLPLGFSREPRQVTGLDAQDMSWNWSPDSRQILLEGKTGTFLLNAGQLTPINQLVNIEGKRLEEVLQTWEEQKTKKLAAQLTRLPREMRDILERKAENIVFSPDENKVLYEASASAQIPDELIPPLPGSSTQKQERTLKEENVYVYDLKEDRNFLVISHQLRWFPTSNHLVLAEPDKITIMDYDGTNRQVVWAGPYESPYAIPFPNTTRLLILTSLGAGNGNSTNLYGLSLR